MTRGSIRKLVSPIFETPATKLLTALGVTPNAVTLIGLIGAIASAALVALGHLAIGGISFLIFGALDLLDGNLARSTGKATPSGAFLDSVTDRLSESVMLLGVLVFFINRESHVGSFFNPNLGVILVSITIIGSVMVSYVRARSEGVGVDINNGIMTRPERVVTLGVGLIFSEWWLPALSLTLGIVAALSIITSLQRIVAVHKILVQRENSSP